MPRSFNTQLAPLPDDMTVLRAVSQLEHADREARSLRNGVTASRVAHRLGIEPANRLGNGAVQGSWSGKMSPALRIAPRLERLYRLGWIFPTYGDRSRKEWSVTQAGREQLAREEAS